MAISGIEYAMHVSGFIFSGITLVVCLATLFFLKLGDFKKIAMLLLLGIAFSTFRWAGGSLVRLSHPWMNIYGIQVLWWLSGVLAAVFAIWGAILLIGFSKKYGFK